MHLLSREIRPFVFSMAVLCIALGTAFAQDVAVSVSVMQDFDKKPVAINDTTQAKVKATADPVPPPYCVLDPSSSWTWTWEIVPPPPNATVVGTPDASDTSQVTVTALFTESADSTITVKASVSIGNSCGPPLTGSGYASLFLTAVKVKAIQYSVDGIVFQDATSTLFVPLGSSVTFKALPSPDGAFWPAGYPVWGGSSGATGTGDVTIVTFNTLSTDGGDFKIVTANCGNTETAFGMVYDFDGVLTPVVDFEGRSYTRYGVCETINLSCTITPSSLTEADIGGLQWDIHAGGGELTGGSGGTGSYVCSEDPGQFVLKLFISAGPFVGQKEKKKEADKDAPTKVNCEQAPNTTIWHVNGTASAGFKSVAYYEPKNVDFSGIVTREESCFPDKMTGGMIQFEKDQNQWPKGEEHPQGDWGGVDEAGKDGKGSKEKAIDIVKSHYYEKKYWEKDSEFNWPIPWSYKKKGTAGNGRPLFTVNQNWTWDAAGTLTISKPRGEFSKTTKQDDATETTGW